MKKILIFIVIAFILLGCSFSSESKTTTEFTTTDSDGNTTTTTAVRENGVTTSDTIVSSPDDPTGLRNKWKEFFVEGAKGQSADGYNVYFAYNDPESITYAAIMILNDDNSELFSYLFGDVVEEDDHFKIVDVDGEEELPFVLSDTEVENGFELVFKDGDYVELHFVDQETIINDMIGIWEEFQQEYQENH